MIENLSDDQLLVLVFLMAMGLAMLAVFFWKSWHWQIRRKGARAMKRGNEIYRDWKRDTVRQPME